MYKLPKNTCPDTLENHMTKLQMPKIYLRTGANMCPPEIRNVHGKHNSFVTAKREYFYIQRRPDSKLESNIMLHFTRNYTVCYGQKELQAQKYNILEKFT